jgi:hypothetical protein
MTAYPQAPAPDRQSRTLERKLWRLRPKQRMQSHNIAPPETSWEIVSGMLSLAHSTSRTRIFYSHIASAQKIIDNPSSSFYYPTILKLTFKITVNQSPILRDSGERQ